MSKIEISKKHAIEIFTGLSFGDCAQWDAEKWGKRLTKLPALLAGPDTLSTMVSNSTDSDLIKQVKEYRASIKADPTTTFAIVAKAVSPEQVAANAGTKVKPEAPAEAAIVAKGVNTAAAAAAPKKVVEQRTIPEVDRAVKASEKKPETPAKKAVTAPEKPKAKAAVAKKTVKAVPYEERFARLVDDPNFFKATGGNDKFGFRKGTMAAVVNAKLTGEWQTTDEIVGKLKNVQRYRVTDHMWKMRKIGFAEADEAITQHRLTPKGLKANFETDAPAPKAKKPAKPVKPSLPPKEAVKAQIQATIDKAKKGDAKAKIKAAVKAVAKKPVPKITAPAHLAKKHTAPAAVKQRVAATKKAKVENKAVKKAAPKKAAPVAKKKAGKKK